MVRAYNKITNEMIKEIAREHGVEVIDIKRDGRLRILTTCSDCNKTKENYTDLDSIRKDKNTCKECCKKKIGKSNSKPKKGESFAENDFYNRSKYWNNIKNKITPWDVSKKSGKSFWFICENGHEFNSILYDVNSNGSWCPHCDSLIKESKMCSTLKQVLKHEFKNTRWEHDLGFKGEKGGTSKYDIFVPELNLVIECQSEYHDSLESIKLDKKKKEFALNLGYDFMAIDYRDFTPLESIRLFFPKTKSIPEYVDYNNSTLGWDIEKTQILLDTTDITLLKIADILGVKPNTIYSAIDRGTLVMPSHRDMKKPIIQLSLNGKYINRYDSTRECCRLNNDIFLPSTICNCCKGNTKSHGGFLWMYESEYEKIKNKDGSINTNYKNPNKFENKGIVQLDLSGKYVAYYKNGKECSEKTGFKYSYIRECCKGKTKTSNGFTWMFKDDYDKYKNEHGNIDSVKEYIDFAGNKGIIQFDLDGKIVNKYKSAMDCYKLTGMNRTSIGNCCNGKQKTAYGFKWMFELDYNK